MKRLSDCVTFSLPDWAIEEIANLPEFLPTVEDQMAVAIRLSERNTREGTGGPFGTVIVESATGRLVAIGVNRVVPLSCSLLHGENVAIAMAQHVLNNFNLGAPELPAHRLVTSAQPCCMCCGAIAWSGVTSLVTGASGKDVESLTGFDEGPIHPQWAAELRKRGIEVQEAVMRVEACSVLDLYRRSGGRIYNGR